MKADRLETSRGQVTSNRQGQLAGVDVFSTST